LAGDRIGRVPAKLGFIGQHEPLADDRIAQPFACRDHAAVGLRIRRRRDPALGELGPKLYGPHRVVRDFGDSVGLGEQVDGLDGFEDAGLAVEDRNADLAILIEPGERRRRPLTANVDRRPDSCAGFEARLADAPIPGPGRQPVPNAFGPLVGDEAPMGQIGEGCPGRSELIDGHPRAGVCPLDHTRVIDVIEWVRDDNIVSYSSPWYDDPEDFWDETGRRIKDYRRDRQAGQRVRIELWCEAAGMGPQLDLVCRDYSVPVFSNGGNNSISAQRQVVDHALSRDVPTVLLHVGDFDP
jgi:hypothetical protein